MPRRQARTIGAALTVVALAAAIGLVATTMGPTGQGGRIASPDARTGAPSPSGLPSPLVVGQLRALHWTGPNRLIAVTSDRLFLSADGGRTWRALHGPRDRDLLTAASTPGGRIIAIASAGGTSDPTVENSYFLERSDDDGATWAETDLRRAASVRAFLSIPDDGPIVALLGTARHAAAGATIATSSDSGISWIVNSVPRPLLSGPISSHASMLTSVAWDGIPGELPVTAVTSDDLGVTWQARDIPPPEGFAPEDRSGIAVDQSDSGSGSLVGAIFESSERSVLALAAIGAPGHEQTMPRPVTDIGAVSIAGSTVIVAVAGQLWRSRDGGATWSATSIELPGTVDGAEFRSETQGWVELSAGDRFDIAETSDGGGSWSLVLQHD